MCRFCQYATAHRARSHTKDGSSPLERSRARTSLQRNGMALLLMITISVVLAAAHQCVDFGTGHSSWRTESVRDHSRGNKCRIRRRVFREAKCRARALFTTRSERYMPPCRNASTTGRASAILPRFFARSTSPSVPRTGTPSVAAHRRAARSSTNCLTAGMCVRPRKDRGLTRSQIPGVND